MEAAALAFIALLVSFLLIFGLDRFFQTPTWLRLVIFALGFGILSIGVPIWIHRWVWGHRHEKQLAQLIARRNPQLGDKLLGIIEFQNQPDHADGSSPRLRQAAIQALAKDTEMDSLLDALPVSTYRKWLLVAAGFSLAASLAFLLSPSASFNALERWLKPLAVVERFTFTNLENLTKSLVVPYGEPFGVELKLSANSAKRPAYAYAKFGADVSLEAKREGSSYNFFFPSFTEPDSVHFQVGDKTHSMEILPMQRPSPVQTLIYVKPPAYLGVPEYSQNLSSGEIRLVEGSQALIEMKMNRFIRSGRYGSSQGSKQNALPLAGDLLISGTKIRTPLLPIASTTVQIPFSWVDEFGLNSYADYELKIQGSKDLAPRISLQNRVEQKSILPEESIEFTLLSEDDFGLKNIGLEWRSVPLEKNQDSKVLGEVVLKELKPEDLRVVLPTIFSPQVFRIRPQKIELRAFSEDRFPERGRSYSKSIFLHVLSREEHMQILKEQYQKSLHSLEDLARREMNLLDENAALSKLELEVLSTETSRKTIEAQQIAERESLRRMKEVQKGMEEIIRGAMRNEQIEKPIFRKMADALKAIQEMGNRSIPKVRDQLTEATNFSKKTKEQLEGAVVSQTLLVEKMRESIEKAKLASEQFEASTFVTRLQKASKDQTQIFNNMLEIFTRDTIGMRPEEIDPSDQFQLNDSAKLQSTIASDVRWIEEDLRFYIQRTLNPSFESVVQSIQTSQIYRSLDENREELLKNHSFTAAKNAAFWAGELTKWADDLAAVLQGNASAGAGGQGVGSPNAEDDDFEFMLRVMKMVQNEQDLRARTRAFEQLKRQSSSTDPQSQ